MSDPATTSGNLTVFLVDDARPGVYACSRAVYRSSICHEGSEGPVNELTRIGYRECTRAQYLAARTALSPDAAANEIIAIVDAWG